ncbi:hypothetical protein MKW94_003783, partial [Papaver nudicaule]|nr:hypothetical protein [Papaver nudicaule]
TRLSRNLGIQLGRLIAQHGSQHKVLHHELERKAVEAHDRVSESKWIHSEALE